MPEYTNPSLPTGRTRATTAGWPRGVVVRVAIALALALFAQVLHVVAPSDGGVPAIDLDSPKARLASSIPLSNADPLYPPNHTFDSKIEDLGSATNADFETPPAEVGTPPQNHDLEAPPAPLVDVPNGDFETGDFTSWTLSGAPTIESDLDHGYFASLGSSATITTTALALPAEAETLTVEVGYLSSSSYSWIEIDVLSGVDFATSTEVASRYCSSCGTWRTENVDVAAFSGQTVKVRFRQDWGVVGVDGVRFEDPLPGFELTGGTFSRVVEDGNTVIEASDTQIVTSPFTVDGDTQFGTLRLKGSSTSSQYKVHLAVGPDFGTWTELVFANGTLEWSTIQLNLTPWRGQSVKLRVEAWWKTFWFDDIGVQVDEISGWEVDGTAQVASEASGNHFVDAAGALTTR